MKYEHFEKVINILKKCGKKWWNVENLIYLCAGLSLYVNDHFYR